MAAPGPPFGWAAAPAIDFLLMCSVLTPFCPAASLSLAPRLLPAAWSGQIPREEHMSCIWGSEEGGRGRLTATVEPCPLFLPPALEPRSPSCLILRTPPDKEMHYYVSAFNHCEHPQTFLFITRGIHTFKNFETRPELFEHERHPDARPPSPLNPIPFPRGASLGSSFPDIFCACSFVSGNHSMRWAGQIAKLPVNRRQSGAGGSQNLG